MSYVTLVTSSKLQELLQEVQIFVLHVQIVHLKELMDFQLYGVIQVILV